jgi:tetratricopeptide (TPR) repeat protein
MYVCLKNVFSTRNLDSILLREYASLTVEQQELYRTVAALEASGTRIHRQLVLRLLGIEPDTISGLLHLMEGLITEYDIDRREGLYGWSTRHPLIAERIAYYKYAVQEELVRLLQSVVDNLNPSIDLELRTLRQLCNYDYGIRHIEDQERQALMYRQLIELAPGERIPRHRLIGTYLHAGKLEEAAHELREAEEKVGLDPPLSRFKPRLALRRAEQAEGIQDADRIVMYAEARSAALAHLRQFPNDKYGYITYSDVGLSLANRYENLKVLDDAIARMTRATARILDPQLGESLDQFISIRSHFPDRDSSALRRRP